jgi:magnesium chelatase family protein
VLEWLREGIALAPAEPSDEQLARASAPDLGDVAGQAAAKRALEIAAAGSHHLYLLGVPGAGKTMLAERLPGLLPLLDDDLALEVTAVHSVAGRLAERTGLIRVPPLQAPHHTATVAALVGGGSGIARPGAISLAHGGVLFLDEAAEFSPRALDAMRQPLESGSVVLHRGGGAVRYPARFQLVLAANPCPCGRAARECECPPHARRRYAQRLSGPLLDRVDLRVHVEAVPHAELLSDGARESSDTVAQRVAQARGAARERWQATPWSVNGAVPGTALRSSRWRLPHTAARVAEEFLVRGQLTARGLDRVLRLAWTVADLAGHSRPDDSDVAEALFFRTGDSAAWAA